MRRHLQGGHDTWASTRTTSKVLQRLAPLDAIDQLTDTERHTNVSHLRRTLYTRCAANQSSYYAACMPEATVTPMLHAAQCRLRISWESLTCADASPIDRRDRAWMQSQLPTNLGGCGLHDTLSRRPAIRTASQLATLLTLRRTSPIFAAADPLTSTTSTLPFFVELRDTYEWLRREHARLLALQADFDRSIYITLYGTTWTRYRPASLPPAKAFPPLHELLSPAMLAKYMIHLRAHTNPPRRGSSPLSSRTLAGSNGSMLVMPLMPLPPATQPSHIGRLRESSTALSSAAAPFAMPTLTHPCRASSKSAASLSLPYSAASAFIFPPQNPHLMPLPPPVSLSISSEIAFVIVAITMTDTT